MDCYRKRRVSLTDQSIDAPKIVPRYTSGNVGEKRLPIVLAPYEKSKDITIVTAPWGESVYRRDVAQRLAVEAEALGTNVIGLGTPGLQDSIRHGNAHISRKDNPGLGGVSLRLSSSERRRVSHSDLSVVAKMHWASLDQLVGSAKFRAAKRTIMGYSLGAATAAALAANAPTGMHIDHLILHEPVPQAIKLHDLAKRLLSEVEDLESYQNERPDWAVAMDSALIASLKVARFALHNISYARALTGGSIYRDVVTAQERGVLDEDSVVTIVSGSRSRVSPESENDKLATELSQQADADVRQLVIEAESHGVIDSPVRMSKILNEAVR